MGKTVITSKHKIVIVFISVHGSAEYNQTVEFSHNFDRQFTKWMYW